MKKLLLLFSYLLLNFNSFSQLLTTNTFTGISACPTNGNTFSPVTNFAVTPLSRNTITCNTTANVFNNTTLNNFNNTKLNNTAPRSNTSYIEFGITANSGFSLNLTSLAFFRQASGTAPNSLIVSYSTDAVNFNTTRVDMATSINPTTGAIITWNFPSPITTASGGNVTFRFYPFGTQRADNGTTSAAASTGTFRLDDVTLNGTIVNASPILTATPTTIPSFNYVLGNGPSTAGSYILSGAALTPTVGDITVTAPTNFEVSKTGITTEFTNNVTVAYTGGGLANTTVYARLKTGLPIGSYMGNVTHSGGGASIINVAVSGTVTSVPPPVITTTGTLSTFNTVIGTPSASQPYTIEGVNLVSDITITAPTDFEIKTGAAAYANTLNLTPSSGTVTTKTIDVRLKGTNTGTFSGNITHASMNVSPDINVAVNGIVGANCGTVTNIAAVRATIPVQRLYTEGGITTITGRVTARLGNPKFYLQDATGGIAVYSTNNGGVAQANNIAVGDSIILTGQIYRALGESEIFNPTCVTKISTGTAPAPVIYNSNMPSGVDLNTFLATNEGKLVRLPFNGITN